MPVRARPQSATGSQASGSSNHPRCSSGAPTVAAGTVVAGRGGRRGRRRGHRGRALVAGQGRRGPGVGRGHGRRRRRRRGHVERRGPAGVQGGLDDDPLLGRVAGMARGEGQDRGVARREDLGLRRRHDELVRDLVGELSAVEGGQDDVVADGQLVDAEERRAVGGPVAGDADVAVLPRQRGVRVVAGPLLQVVDADAGHHDPVQPDGRRLQPGDGIALGGRHGRGRRRRRGRGRRGRRARLAGRGRGGRGGGRASAATTSANCCSRRFWAWRVWMPVPQSW